MLGARIRSWDHPRSRGVYGFLSAWGFPCPGSSPLARGLLPLIFTWDFGHRIIPARAGFTLGYQVPGAEWWDHPRSRGVYPFSNAFRMTIRGSSPLARGLLVDARCVVGLWGIIPARAGFTKNFSRKPHATQDHPRSRGVYVEHGYGLTAHGGSSPLARGLHQDQWPAPHGSGIIPARAGFTLGLSLCRFQSPDHPRSRGVYSSGRRSS